MSQQPDALRLAAALDSDPSDITGHKAAAELRRLHAENAALLEQNTMLDAKLAEYERALTIAGKALRRL